MVVKIFSRRTSVKKKKESVKDVTPIGRFLVSHSAAAKKISRIENCTESTCDSAKLELGDGTPTNPHYLLLRERENTSYCYHCPFDTCKCTHVKNILSNVYKCLVMKRITEVAGSRHLCAKSLLPTFITRMIRLMKITSTDIFYDFGCGNGSVLFQVACLTNARCVGVELSEHNAQVARLAWPIFRSSYVKSYGEITGSVEIITGDISKILQDRNFFEASEGKAAILLSNLVFPKPLTHFISEWMRKTPSGTRILCFDDLYPHGRSIAAIRDPEAFALFEMQDYIWQEMSVEWCADKGDFYIHWHR